VFSPPVHCLASSSGDLNGFKYEPLCVRFCPRIHPLQSGRSLQAEQESPKHLPVFMRGRVCKLEETLIASESILHLN
jgi:hypothetical protein